MEEKTRKSWGPGRVVKFGLLAVGVLIFSAVSYCSLVHVYGPYYGTVVDLETQEPIEGAVVLVWFYFSTVGAGSEGPAQFVDAAEAVTDSSGRFSIPMKVEFNRGWVGWWDPDASVRVFKAGYGCYPLHRGSLPHIFPSFTIPAWESVRIQLPKARGPTERLKSTSCAPDFEIPCQKARRMLDAINEERQALNAGKLSCP